jgi:hypothetical protein
MARNMNWISYYNASAQSINASADVVITVNSGIFKSYGTVPIAYNSGTGVFSNTSGTTIVLSISWNFGLVNGAFINSTYSGWITPPASYSIATIASMSIPATSGQTISLNGATILVLTSGETFNITARHNAGAAINTATAWPTQIFMTLLQ